MLIPYLKIQILAQMLPWQRLSQQAKDYHYDQTNAVTMKVIVKMNYTCILKPYS